MSALILSVSGILVSSNQSTFPQTEALIPSLATGVVKRITGITQTMSKLVGDLISTITPRWIFKRIRTENNSFNWNNLTSGKFRMLPTNSHWQCCYNIIIMRNDILTTFTLFSMNCERIYQFPMKHYLCPLYHCHCWKVRTCKMNAQWGAK